MNQTTIPLMPREKLLTEGAEALSDSELLAIFLRTGVKGKSVIELADEALSHFGSLRYVLSANLEQFSQVKGLGETQFVQLQATKELNKRYLAQKIAFTDILDSPEAAIMYFKLSLEDIEREVFMVLFLDNQNRVIHIETLFLGTINQTTVHPREIIKAALKHNAAGILVAHNHPSGVCQPSIADRLMNSRIEKACELIELRMLDHIIVGKGDYFSFEEEKLELSEAFLSP